MATAERNFMDLLRGKWSQNKRLCIGLDSAIERLPVVLRDALSPCDAQKLFNQAVVDATKHVVAAYKPNLAFYRGGNGKYVLRDTIVYINQAAPDVPVILDAKWGDIGNTNNGYLEELDWFGADAVTINPYLGMEDGLAPFMKRSDKGIIVLCKTSNQGSGEFQNLPVNGRAHDPGIPLYADVARRVAQRWNNNGNCGLVVGATYPSELELVRMIVDNYAEHMPILIPGYGTQGGDLEASVQAGGSSILLNASRGIIFASEGDDYAEAASTAAEKAHDEIIAALIAA